MHYIGCQPLYIPESRPVFLIAKDVIRQWRACNEEVDSYLYALKKVYSTEDRDRKITGEPTYVVIGKLLSLLMDFQGEDMDRLKKELDDIAAQHFSIAPKEEYQLK